MLVIFKTTIEKAGKLAERIAELHSYDCAGGRTRVAAETAVSMVRPQD